MVPSLRTTTPPAFLRLAAHPLRWRLLSELAASDHRVRDLVTRVDRPQNLVSYHVRQLRDGGLVTSTRSSHDGRDTYYHLDLDRCAVAFDHGGAALHPALRRGPAPPVFPLDQQPSRPLAVLFVCTGNGTRSPIAEALLRHHTAGQVTVASAGTRPRSALHPNTIRVLGEGFGIDVSGRQPQHVAALAGRRFDHVVTLCDRAREACPDLAPHPRQVHWSIPDPAASGGTDRATYPDFERTAAEIATRVRHLLPVLATTGS
jgi:protein-tyrosine-phosphatase/DNA-binding transcriptional ArsR family regulator